MGLGHNQVGQARPEPLVAEVVLHKGDRRRGVAQAHYWHALNHAALATMLALGGHKCEHSVALGDQRAGQGMGAAGRPTDFAGRKGICG